MTVVLFYTVFEKYDVITRSVKVINNGECPFEINKIASASIDFSDSSLEMLHLPGQWARERHIERVKLPHGITTFDSKGGASGHKDNPFVAFCSPLATETSGDVYAMNPVYSGNFETTAELDPFNTLRASVGINSFGFSYKLDPGDEFFAPEAVLTYSSNGFGGMSRNLHDFYRDRMCRGKYKYAKRPVLINNWEATYFDFDEEKLLKIAKKAKDTGVDLFVLDDGWFGKRNDDSSSLGDWYCNKKKLPSGLDGFGKKLNAMGLKFGVWFEPEMISPDSDLYRAHPDWCIRTNGRKPHLGRNQLVLDLTRKEVCDHIVNVISKNLTSAPISYVKWDMNRYLTDVPSGDFAHRYMLGLYSVLERITEKFPDVLFEGCAGGGGRFDPAMLCYFPQIWCSDNTDAEERLYIQYGTSLAYPVCTMGAHVSASPNHQLGRSTPFEMRGNVAMLGQFGYELDLLTLSDSELDFAKEQIRFYKAHQDTIQYGDLYRILSPYDGNICAWQFISKDKKEVIVFAFNITGKATNLPKLIKLQGLDGDMQYKDAALKKTYSGEYLMRYGIPVKCDADGMSCVSVFKIQ